jgi:FkbM family methyltransferase
VYRSGYSQYWMGTYEKEVAELFAEYAKKSNVVYDLGANIGYYSLIAVKSVGGKGIVYAFEPFPQNTKILKQHKILNNADNLIIFESAVSDKTGKVSFSNSVNNVANTICSESPIFLEGKTIEVETVTLDNLLILKEIEPPQLIKIDVEGAEYKVLLGANSLIMDHRPVIFLSTHNCQVPGVHKKCIDLLSNLGYKITYVNYRERITEYDDPWYEILAEFRTI